MTKPQTPALFTKPKSLGLVTLPTMKLADNEERYFVAQGELMTTAKTGKGGKAESDDEGNAKMISTLIVSDMITFITGQLVIGAIGASALAKAGTLKGRGFRILRHSAPMGRPKVWEIEEVEVTPTPTPSVDVPR